MTKYLKMLLVAILAVGGTLVAGSALADVSDSCTTACNNVQEGDNESNSTQEGSASSGDAVGGQVTGVVSSGDATVDATNESTDIDITTGTADGTNDAANFVGLNDGDATVSAADIDNLFAAFNVQEGDNSYTLAQAVDASSGDGVGGQVIGAVTSAGGSAGIVAQNTSTEVDLTTGTGNANNDAAAFVGLSDGGPVALSADIDDIETGINVQEGDNSVDTGQAANAASGDGVGGQVIGAVSSGDATIDASNESSDIDLTTGSAASGNDAAQFAGLHVASNGPLDIDATAADVSNITAARQVQEGDNNATLAQAADASSGDAVGGQVIGAVTSAGGSAGIVAQNSSDDVTIDTGTADANNDAATFTGIHFDEGAGPIALAADVRNITTGFNVQEGDNDLQGGQVADAASGDGVGGQVLGVVSAGDAQVDATNTTDDVNLETGAAASNNDAAYFVGLNVGGGTITTIADIDNVTAANNLQEGNNTKVFAQAADASTGDAVAGQVGGVVTSAGGSADLALDNTSTEVDAQTGATTFNNDDAGFLGLNTGGTLTITG